MSAAKQKLLVTCDQAGIELKSALMSELKKSKADLRDLGVHADDKETDYPMVAARLASAVSVGAADQGVIVSGTGMGAAMVANRFPAVRAAYCPDIASAKIARATMDANILVLDCRQTSEWLAREILTAWLTTSFEGGKRARVVQQIDDSTRLAIAFSHLDQVNVRKLDVDSVNRPFVERASAGLQKIKNLFKDKERRRADEPRQSQTLPAKFKYDGCRLTGLVTDLTMQGAQLKLKDEQSDIRFIHGDELKLSIKTPFGMAECTAVIRWADSKSGILGVSFSNLPKGKDNPLAAMVDSML